MHRTPFRLATAALGLAALAATTTSAALADGRGGREQRACYATKEFGDTRLALDVTFHSKLPTSRSGGFHATWDVAGKHGFVDGANKNHMAAVDGTVVTSS